MKDIKMSVMKKIIKPFIYILLTIISFSCEDELVDKAVLDSDPDTNALNNLPSTTYTLTFEDQGEEFDEFNWSATDFGFPASITYTLQVDADGSDFTNAVELTSTQQLSATVTQGDINEALLTLGLNPDQLSDVQFRIMSAVGSGVEPVYSNAINVGITPFATSFEPIYIIGDAQNWDLTAAAELEATGPGTYEGTADFVNEGIFRFFASPDWAAEQWGASYFAGGDLPDELVDNGDGDSNFRYTGPDGTYFVTVDLNTKTITLTEQNYPETLYIIGDDQAWDLSQAFQLTPLGDGVFEGVGQFGNGNIWRFFEIPDWGATQWNYNNFDQEDIDSDLTGTTEGDANFTFIGETGLYKITVSLVDFTIEMEPSDPPALYIIGDDQAWDLAQAFEMTWMGNQVYQGTTEFNSGSIFRFFENPDWGAPQWNYNNFVDGTIDEANLSGTTEGDANFTFIGTSGTYTIEVDLINQTIVMSQ